MGVVVPGLIRVLMPNGQVVVMKLETYLAGVVFCEIGANGPLEALKAQAVASRTYAASAHRHPELGADVCTSAHCQDWKRVDPIVAPEVFRAVSETWGIVAIHDGRLIDAFFFEHCDGHTRSSEDVLMPAIPYLRSVECACGFVAMKGHGVGLCQRGAVVMARRGASFEQILRHYYHDVVVIHTSLEPGQAIAPRPMPRATVSRETASAQSNGTTKKAPPSAGRPKVGSSRKSPTPVKLAPKPPPPVTIKETAPVEPKEPSIEPAAPMPERPKPPTEPSTPAPVPQPVAAEPQVAEEQPRGQLAGDSRRASEPAQELGVAETPPIIAVDEPAAPDFEQPVLASGSEPKQPAAIEPSPVPEPAESSTESPVVAVETNATEPQETAQQILLHVEPLKSSATLTEGENGAAPVSTLGPVAELPSIPFIHESELPALHETVSAKTPRMHVDHLPGGRLIAGCLPSAGTVVRIQDRHGNETLVFSGSAAHYGEGGFETMVGEDGRYVVVIGEEQVEVKVQGDTVFIHPL